MHLLCLSLAFIVWKVKCDHASLGYCHGQQVEEDWEHDSRDTNYHCLYHTTTSPSQEELVTVSSPSTDAALGLVSFFPCEANFASIFFSVARSSGFGFDPVTPLTWKTPLFNLFTGLGYSPVVRIHRNGVVEIGMDDYSLVGHLYV